MSALTTSAPETKTCEGPECQAVITRDRKRENPSRWASRRYCGKPCAAAARRATPAKPSLPPPPTPRISERGVWRPNAPGWPAEPVIPTHLRRTP